MNSRLTRSRSGPHVRNGHGRNNWAQYHSCSPKLTPAASGGGTRATTSETGMKDKYSPDKVVALMGFACVNKAHKLPQFWKRVQPSKKSRGDSMDTFCQIITKDMAMWAYDNRHNVNIGIFLEEKSWIASSACTSIQGDVWHSTQQQNKGSPSWLFKHGQHKKRRPSRHRNLQKKKLWQQGVTKNPLSLHGQQRGSPT